MDHSPVTAYIALGSNLGDRAALIASAIELLGATVGVNVTKTATPIETAAVGGPADSPPFLNSAVEVLTTLSPADLLRRMSEIETSLGRVRREKWGPRPIDLDLVIYGDRVIDEPGLVVPHPLLHTRPFVLIPLAEIAADVIHPVFGRAIRDLSKADSSGL